MPSGIIEGFPAEIAGEMCTVCAAALRSPCRRCSLDVKLTDSRRTNRSIDLTIPSVAPPTRESAPGSRMPALAVDVSQKSVWRRVRK